MILKRLRLINSGTVFLASIVIIPTLALIVYLTGLQTQRSLYLNSLITTTILAIVFFSFILAGLYRGWKLKETLGNFRKFFSRYPNRPGLNFQLDGPPIPGDPEGIVIAILLWIVVGLFGLVILWLLGAFFWGTLLALGAILYWIIFRALRLIFRNSGKSKGNFSKSIQIAFLYTVLYISWIYVIIFAAQYLKV